MKLAPRTTLHGFTIQRRDPLPEIDGESIEGIHEASGARLLVLKNDDNNKSFAIGFRTPPQDDTGVFHILEHSVLCGSRRFPVKEPFVDLLKGSMQTFLNAMTFGDKTLYPVASTNEQDLLNLMDVYLDAVFHPNIYEKRAIFEQEGWHYELVANDPDYEGSPADLDAGQTTLVHNGVVFNEMKGALSDARSVLYDEVQSALFPDNCYEFESGGTPAAIPTLTYENYLDEHRRHYRTDNSYIILYGNLDIERALAFLDERYLVPVAAEQRELDAKREAEGLEPLVPRSIALQTPVAPAHKTKTMDTAPENACTACGYVIGPSSEHTRSIATEIMLDALFGSNEAPLKRALLDAGIAHDVHAFVSDALLQPFAMVELQMPAEGAGEKLASTLSDEVRKLIDAGLDLDLIEAALSHEEFQMREHDMGMADGVVNSMIALSGWLYDDDATTDYLRYESTFAELREQLNNGYFERLMVSLFCENDHMASVEVVPTPGQADDDSAERLAHVNEGLTADERARIVQEEALLRELQEAPDTPEAIATLPRLGVADIDDAPVEPAYAIDDQAPLHCVRHAMPTRGIAYAYRYFDMAGLAFDDLPYVSILANVLGKLDTAHHTAAEIDTLAQGKLGNLSFFTDVYEARDINAPLTKLVVSASSLAENAEWLATLPREIMLETDFSNLDKILNVLKQRKIGMEHTFANSGHSCASARLKSYYAKAGVVREQMGNIGFYRFLCDLIDNFDERGADLSIRLADVARRLFRDNRCTVSFAGGDAAYDRFWQAGPECGQSDQGANNLVIPEPVVHNEAFIVPSDVCYAAVGWDRRLVETCDYTGAWLVAARAISYDYLWNEVRVKGGAYGTGFQAMRAGNMRFYSYRDPHLDDTIARFAKTVDWMKAFNPNAVDLEGFVVATVASLDAPKKPREIARRQMGDFFTHRAPEERIDLRRQVIATDAQAVQALAPVLDEVIAQHAMCVFGNRAILEGARADFEVIPLVG